MDNKFSFARDVAVNVVANLFAAAILYVIGVGAGLLPTNWTLLISAAVVVTFVLGMTLYIASMMVFRGRRLESRKSVTLATGGVGLMGVASIVAAFVQEGGLSPFEKVLYVIMGASLIVLAVTTYVDLTGRIATKQSDKSNDMVDGNHQSDG